MAQTAARTDESESPESTKNSVHYERASTTLLAKQPNVTDKKPKTNVAEWNILRGHLEANLVAMRMWRNSWWTQNWSTIAEYLLPRRSIWLTQSTGGIPSPNNMTRGRPLNNSIKDPTATFALRVCAAGYMSGTASPSRPWFKITTSLKNFQPDAEGRAWMDEVEDRFYTVLAGSNFYNSYAQECEDSIAFGTAPAIMYEDEKDIIRMYNPTNGEYFLSSSATMRTDGLSRLFVMTIKQIVDFFGIENCPADVQGLWKQKGASLSQEKIIGHTIEPNFDLENCPRIPGNFAFREVYWVYGAGSEYPLSKKGFVDQPFTDGIWASQSNDPYGRGPGMDVLPDVIQLQVMTVRLSEAIEKQVRPPLVADMTMKNQPSSILPGHVTYVQSLAPGTGMRSIYEVNPDIKGLSGLILQIEQRIQRGLFNDLFLMLSENPTQKQTAYEVAQKMQEKLQVLGPSIENSLNGLKTKLKRLYGIMNRKNMLPPMPESMKGVPLDVEFISILALAQKASNTGGLERLIALVGNMSAVYPEVKDLVNVDTFIREFNDLLDNPNSILNGEDIVAQMREKAAKQQQAAAAMTAMQHGMQTAQVGAQAANVLSNTQIGGGQQALQALLGGQAQGGSNG